MTANPPSLTADLRRGDETQVLMKLQQDGITHEDYAAIAQNNAMRAEIVAAMLKHRLFASPEEQIATLLRINVEVWKDPTVTEEAIRALGDPPVAPSSDEHHLWCTVLLRETGDPVQTFAENWAACQFIHAQNWKWDGLVLTPAGVQIRAGAIVRPKGLRWSTAELGRERQNQKVEDVRPALDRAEQMGIGQEGPFIAAMHPRWAIAMNGEGIPFLDMPDIEVRPNADAHGSFSSAPDLCFNRGTGEVRLDASGVAGRSPICGSGVLGE